MSTIQYACTPVQDLIPYARNARTHSSRQIQQVANSITEFGFINPVVIDAKGEIIAGHCRVMAAKKLELPEVPTIRVEHLTEAQVRTYRLADNKLTDNSTWDEQVLRLEIEDLSHIDIDLDVIGFEIPEIDLLLGSPFVEGEENNEPQNIPIPSTPFVQLGDIFILGQHRLICGDCREIITMSNLMKGQRADVVCSDAPYNVKINGHVLVKEKAHEEFAMASGELSKTEFVQFLQESFQGFYDHSAEGSVHFLFMDWRHMAEILEAGNRIYDSLLNLCVWAKTNAGMGSLYRSQHELVFVFKKGRASHNNNVQLGKYGRNRSNLWTYAGMNSLGGERDQLLSQHPTVKPVQLIVDAILDVSKRNGIVLDGFLGSGSTLIAAEQTGRICYGCEIAPRYVEVAIHRFQAINSTPVIHENSGLTFDALKQDRLNEKQ